MLSLGPTSLVHSRGCHFDGISMFSRDGCFRGLTEKLCGVNLAKEMRLLGDGSPDGRTAIDSAPVASTAKRRRLGECARTIL